MAFLTWLGERVCSNPPIFQAAATDFATFDEDIWLPRPEGKMKCDEDKSGRTS